MQITDGTTHQATGAGVQVRGQLRCWQLPSGWRSDQRMVEAAHMLNDVDYPW